MALGVHGVSKSFGPTKALCRVSLQAEPGHILALIGENGAGKSTLLKIISGALSPDEGYLSLEGRSFLPRNPLEASRLGVAMIYQELNLALDLSALENITLGQEPGCFFLRKDRQRTMANRALGLLQASDLPLDEPVRNLTIGQRQLVEIARALVHSPRILLLDEPTSSLGSREVDVLFSVLRRLANEGVAIVYISHFLEECRLLADHFVVLRDGSTVASGNMTEAKNEDILGWMAGRTVETEFPALRPHAEDVVLRVENLSGKAFPQSVAFHLHAGEIIGLAGLIGSGRTETMRALFGLDPMREGVIWIKQSQAGVTRPSPPFSWKAGLGFLSEDRKEEGLLLNRSLVENVVLPGIGPHSSTCLLRPAREEARVRSLLGRLATRYVDPWDPAAMLSGGNQQKVALARLLHTGSRILLLDEPTRGIDISSKQEIYRLMAEAASEGKAILWASSYLPELLGLCHRIAVFHRGRLVSIRPAAEWSPELILQAATGAAQPLNSNLPA